MPTPVTAEPTTSPGTDAAASAREAVASPTTSVTPPIATPLRHCS